MAAGDPSVSCDPRPALFDPSLECFYSCWIPWPLPLSPRSPITSLESAASVLTGSPAPSSSFPLNALSTPGWPMVPRPCSVSAPPETMSPLLTVLPLMCHSAGRPATSSHRPRSLNLLLEGQSSEAQREEGDSPAQQTAILTCHCCQLHLHCQVWGRTLPSSSPVSDQPPRPVTKSDRDECLAPHSSHQP